MPIPTRRSFDSVDPRWRVLVTDDGSPTLVQSVTAEAMHSGCGAVAETRHVYLQMSGVAERLARGLATQVLEVGFGTGLGWLMTAEAALAVGAELRYVGLENRLPPAAVIRQLGWERHVQHPDLVGRHLDWLETLDPQSPRRLRIDRATLEIISADACQWCPEAGRAARSGPGSSRFDAVYFDPFSPELSPQLWQPEVFGGLRQLLRPGGTLVSYCVSRPVRDALTASGFLVHKVAGPPGGKREVLRAVTPTNDAGESTG